MPNAPQCVRLLRAPVAQILPSRSDALVALPVTQADHLSQKSRLHEKSHPSNDQVPSFPAAKKHTKAAGNDGWDFQYAEKKGGKSDPRVRFLVKECAQHDHVAEVVVTYADRLTRFGLEYLTAFFAGYDVRFTVLHPNDGKTPEQELTDDLIAILTSFSGRLYGMRSHKQKEIAARIEEVLYTS